MTKKKTTQRVGSDRSRQRRAAVNASNDRLAAINDALLAMGLSIVWSSDDHGDPVYTVLTLPSSPLPAAVPVEQIQRLREYLKHKDGCAMRRPPRCTCGHAKASHTDILRFYCRFCECHAYEDATPDCTCGLDTLLSSAVPSPSEHPAPPCVCHAAEVINQGEK